ncbi:VOC family protein [Ancylobacter oerskovii]|uniref:VOC family protein n=1 Tax=Ancylobacter oerskovii TaxID=459519 RepID=A0ABW4Z466_9HYPH|nr:VOC family protein [Ancylobacter oerskovii]MBS7545769.1 VOC family protein [Ancylobacter oerskovii]
MADEGLHVARQIFVNLPVKDLKRSVDFFTALGFSFNLQFTDENATCMIIGENFYAMLLVEPYFKSFTHKEIADTSKANEALVALAVDDREAVDALVAKARAAGGAVPRPPQDLGFMYSHGFEDPDGHIWEVFHMSEMPPA